MFRVRYVPPRRYPLVAQGAAHSRGVSVKTAIRSLVVCVVFAGVLAAQGCGAANSGIPGSSAVAQLPITGTVYTIVFENHGVDAVFNGNDPYLTQLADRYGTADAYLANVHPSLPNYLLMTSGSTHGVGDDNGPASHPIDGLDNLADQLEAGGITWRAYMEGMGDPCVATDRGDYNVRHDPFVYYTSLTSDPARCREHVVDFDANFATDLAANDHQFMWITPNICNDMHNCPPSTSDAWLARVIPQIMDSPGYREGGAIFLLWDEGDTDATYAWSYVFHRPQNIPFVLVSDYLVSPGYASPIRFGHDSYLATIEDTFHLPRLPTTVGATPMADFFRADLVTRVPASTAGSTASDTAPPSGI